MKEMALYVCACVANCANVVLAMADFPRLVLHQPDGIIEFGLARDAERDLVGRGSAVRGFAVRGNLLVRRNGLRNRWRWNH